MNDIINKIIDYSNSIPANDVLNYLFRDQLQNIRRNKPLILFGSGNLGANMVFCLAKFGITPTAFCDTIPNDKTSFCNLPVISFATFKAEYSDAVILITAKIFSTTIKKTLLEHGIPASRICWPNDFDEIRSLYFHPVNIGSLPDGFKTADDWALKCAWLEKHAEKITAVYHLLEDQASKDLLIHRIATDLNYDCINHFTQFISLHSEGIKKFGIYRNTGEKYADGIENYFYFNNDIFELEDNEVYVDVGAHTGDSIRPFINAAALQNKQYEEIIAFEPDTECVNTIKKNCGNIQNLTISQMGVWSHTGSEKFMSSEQMPLPGSSYISNSGDVEVKVTTLDDYLNSKKITTLKMDAPGAMLPAIKGGRQHHTAAPAEINTRHLSFYGCSV